MAMLNIPSSVEDPSYRYKMPRIISNKECRGKGSKTSIMNMGDVAHAIKRDPMYLTKFFGYELGAQTSYTNKKGEGERAVINGHHDTAIFQRLLDDFIEKYVLCMECHLPEIDMVVNKKDLVVATCKACGWNGKLDNCHKLATFISKNPPSSGIGFDEEKKDKKSKEDRQRERAAKQKTKEGDGDHDANSDKSEKGHEDKKPTNDKNDKDEVGGEDEAKEKKEKKERKSKKDKTRDQDEDEDEHEDGESKDKQLKKEKKDKKEQNNKKEKKDKKDQKDKKDKKKETETYSGSDEKESDDKEEDQEEEEELRYDGRVMSGVVRDFVELVEKNEKITVDKMYEEVRAQQVTKGFDNKLRMYAVISAIFPNGTLSAKGVKHRSTFIKEFIINGRLPFAEWIWGFEAYLAANPSATKAWAMTLKALYDVDLAEEEQILEYYKGQHDSPGFDASKKAAAPFIKWLETSEDGSDEDGGDEDSD